MRRRFHLTFPMIAAAIIALLLFVPLPWVSWGEEVDIHSGRIRNTVWIVGIPCCRDIEETWVSQSTPPLGEPDWNYAVTHDWWNHVSPHYRYHGAVHQIKTLEILGDGLRWNNDARSEAANELLRRWQTGSYRSADQYLTQVEMMFVEKPMTPTADHAPELAE